MLPGINGFEVLRRIRATSRLPCYFCLPQGGEDVDRIVGLEIGADDYLPKPFNPRELVARIRAVLRRTPAISRSPAAPDIVRVGEIELDPGDAQCAARRPAGRADFRRVQSVGSAVA
jgi:two-component system, OmpR family, response regulator CpxR